MALTYDLISTQTTTTATSSVTFSSIPQTYTDLVVVVRHKHNTLTSNSLGFRLNGDSGNTYSWTYYYDNGTTATGNLSGRNVNYNAAYPAWFVTAGTTEGALTTIQLLDYSNTTYYKSYISRGNAVSTNTTYPGVEMNVGAWQGTSAITSIEFLVGGDFASDSTFSIYGIKAA